MTARTSRTRTITLGAALLAGAAIAAPQALAQGNTVALQGGATDLHLNAATARVLTGAGFTIAPVGPARAAGTRVSFPITGGRIDPRSAAGGIAHSGGLAISDGDTTVRLTNFAVDSRRGTLTVAVGGARLQAIDLETDDAAVIRRGSGGIDTYLVRVRAVLSDDGADALNAAFGTTAFAEGVVLGRVDVKAVPREVILEGGATTVVLSPVTAGALQSLGVNAAPLSPATVADGALRFPVTGGRLTRNFAGSVAHSGGIGLTAGTTRVDLRNFRINLSAGPTLTAQVGSSSVRILNLDASAARTGFSSRNAVVTGVRATLSADAASALNQAFGVTAFAEGLEFGTARIQARVR